MCHREKTTNLINSLVTRDEAGSYGWDLDNPYVQESITVFEEKYQEDLGVGIPYNEMVAKMGGKEGYAEAPSYIDSLKLTWAAFFNNIVPSNHCLYTAKGLF